MSVLIFCLAILSIALQSHEGQSTPQITQPEVSAVVQAVQDEIYDYSFEGDYFQLGPNLTADPQKWKSRVPIYIDPQIEDEGGRAIYKLMHYGEVYRLFSIRKDGVVVLDGNPQDEFPPTQTSLKTLYMNDDEVCKMKHDWLHLFFKIDTAPDETAVRAAARRQKGRTGTSYLESAILPNLKK